MSTVVTAVGAIMGEEKATAAATTAPGIAEAVRRTSRIAALVAALAAPAHGAEIELAISNAGFRPAVLSARKGEPLRLRLVTSDREHCFAIDSLRVEKRVVPGKRVLVELTPEKSGTFPFHCCLEPENEALRGKLVVSD